MNGFLVLNKPLGMSSSACVVRVRKRLPRGSAVGHGGTLDPQAEGVLPICIGAATRLFDYIIEKKKVYVAQLQLGQETDTQDATGQVIRERPVFAGRTEIEAVLPRFTGEILQIPPMYSALHSGGKRLYELARRGETVELQPRPCRVDAIRLLEQTGENRYRLEIACGKGVYIRTLCHDIGQALGCGGHMASLLRTRAGVFSLEKALTLEEIADLSAEELERHLLSMDFPIRHLPRVCVAEDRRRWVENGNPIKPAWLDAPAPMGEALRVYVGEEFAGIGQTQEDGSVRFRCMLLSKE